MTNDYWRHYRLLSTAQATVDSILDLIGKNKLAEAHAQVQRPAVYDAIVRWYGTDKTKEILANLTKSIEEKEKEICQA